jgi:hypothetical protein
MRPSQHPSRFSSSPSLRREGRSFFALIAGLITLVASRSAPVDISGERYRGVALGVEAAWPDRDYFSGR